MPASSFFPLVPRQCAWCQDPLQGRSDKQFCSAACRSMAKRHGVANGAPIDWPARATVAEQAVQVLQAQFEDQAHALQVAFPFEQGYDNLLRLLGQVIQEVERVRVMSSYLDFVNQLLVYYQQHPGIVSGEAHAQRRLGHLQQLRAEIVAHLAMLQQREEQGRRRQVAADEAAQLAADANSKLPETQVAPAHIT